MTKHRIPRGKPDIRIGVALILAGVLALAGAGRGPERRTPDGSPAGVAPSGSIIPGLAQAGVDTLDLQLD